MEEVLPMAYAIENAGRRRAQALVAVGLLHGVAIWAIASGFAGGVVNIVRDTLVAQQWREEVKITPISTARGKALGEAGRNKDGRAA